MAEQGKAALHTATGQLTSAERVHAEPIDRYIRERFAALGVRVGERAIRVERFPQTDPRCAWVILDIEYDGRRVCDSWTPADGELVAFVERVAGAMKRLQAKP